MPHRTKACAHRGDCYWAPENTLPAFALAVEKGASQIEFDVRITKDKQLIVMHDETVNRTTNGQGKTTDLTLTEIKRLDAGSWKGPQYAGTRVPTLAEVLQLIPPGPLLNVQLYLEPSSVPLVVEEIRAAGKTEQCILACGNAHIKIARQIEPQIRWANLDGQRGPDSDYPDIVIASGAEFIQIVGWADCLPDVVAKLHQHNVLVNFFGTEDPALMRKLISAGVDYIMTDHLDLLLEVLACQEA